MVTVSVRGVTCCSIAVAAVELLAWRMIVASRWSTRLGGVSITPAGIAARGTSNGATPVTVGPSTWAATLDLPHPLDPMSAVRSPRRTALSRRRSVCSLLTSSFEGDVQRSEIVEAGAALEHVAIGEELECQGHDSAL